MKLLKDLQKGSDVPISDHPFDIPPPWMDFEKFKRGRELFPRHLGGMLLGVHYSVMLGLSVNNILSTLVYTKRSSTPKSSFTRYMQTYLHIALWHFEDVFEAPNGIAHRSMKKVRMMHKKVDQAMNSQNNDQVNGVKKHHYFSQYDYSLVQATFIGPMTMYPEKMGISCTKEEVEDYIFFWRVIGYLLGVEDEYNFCSGNYEETMNLSREVAEDIVWPALRNPPAEFTQMADAFIAGTNVPLMFEFFTRDAMQAYMFVADDPFSLPMPKLSFPDWLRYWGLKTLVFMIRWLPFFARFTNFLARRRFYQELHWLKL